MCGRMIFGNGTVKCGYVGNCQLPAALDLALFGKILFKKT